MPAICSGNSTRLKVSKVRALVTVSVLREQFDAYLWLGRQQCVDSVSGNVNNTANGTSLRAPGCHDAGRIPSAC